MAKMIDRWKLENGTIKERIEQIYAITEEDIIKDQSIIEILRENLKIEDNELLEISIMRLGIRAKDLRSKNEFLNILACNSDALVRSAAIAALSSLYRVLIIRNKGEAYRLLRTIEEIPLSSSEVEQITKDFRLI
jgi:hypothetical protein